MARKNEAYFCVSEGAVFAISKANAENIFPRNKRKKTFCTRSGITPIK